MVVKIFSFEIRKDPFVKNISRNEVALAREVLFSFLFHGADNHTGGEKFGIQCFGELNALGVFAGHWQTENIDTAGAKPFFNCGDFVFHGFDYNTL